VQKNEKAFGEAQGDWLAELRVQMGREFWASPLVDAALLGAEASKRDVDWSRGISRVAFRRGFPRDVICCWWGGGLQMAVRGGWLIEQVSSEGQ
jgi:hypothetical protein